ncbi:MAG: hypothetical protein ACYTGZ_05965 [Planctomycetota bacterium]
MTEPWRSIFFVVCAAWAGSLVYGIGHIARMLRRDGVLGAWPALRVWAPGLDLFGTWAGAAAIASLAMGRVGVSAGWAGAMLCAALGVTAGLYDRAVLVPSLDAAFKRLEHEPGEEKWQQEWRFLWRMASGARALTLALALVAIACVASSLW